MLPERFDHLLSLLMPLISKKYAKFRKSIASNEHLALTLRFLASGESQISLSFQFWLGRATVSKIISECCEAIYQVLSEKYLWSPKLPKEWKAIAQQLEDTWNMPHVIGTIDGKHVRIKCLRNTGSLNYCFALFDVCQYCSNNNSGVLIYINMGV